MEEYKEMYLKLLSAQLDTLHTMRTLIDNLIKAQQEAEELFLSKEDSNS